MDKIEISMKVESVFAKYPRPNKNKIGGRGENWIDSLSSMDLKALAEDDLVEAVFHVFPTNYGDVDVFRYLLPRSLELSFFHNDYTEPNPRYSEHEELLNLLFIRCCQWKSYLKSEEVAVLDEVFCLGVRQYYSIHNRISPFYFCLFLLWRKEVPDFSFLGDCSEIAIENLKEKLFDFITEGYFVTVNEVSPTKLILTDLQFDLPVKDSNVVDCWSGDYLFISSIVFQEIFSSDDIIKCDAEINSFMGVK